jgi:5-methylcytosine-specific restriction endonuclease McrA
MPYIDTPQATRLQRYRDYIHRQPPEVIERWRESQRASYRRNAEKRRKRSLIYYRKHKKQRIEAAKTWAIHNPEKVRAIKRRSAIKNRDKILLKAKLNRPRRRNKATAYARLYRAKNRKYVNAVCAARNARRRARLIGSSIDPAKVTEFIFSVRSRESSTCYYCKRQLQSKNIQIDHVVPLIRGGRHEIGNLCTACPTCNQTKREKLPIEWKPIGQLTML